MIKPNGFIMVLTLSLIALMVILVSFGINRVSGYRTASQLWADREKARVLALGCIAIAQSQIATLFNYEKLENKDEHEKLQEKRASILFDKLNQWQTFNFTESHEGIDAECRLYISPESGKLNLNFFALDKNLIIYPDISDNKKFLERLDTVVAKMGTGFERSMKPLMESFLKTYVLPVDEPTLMLSLPLAKPLQYIYPNPDEKQRLSFVDLFTVYSDKPKINPMFISQSVGYLYGFNVEREKDYKKLPYKEILELLTLKKINWIQQWDKTLGVWYKTDYKSLPDELKPLFETTLDVREFFVMSYVKIRNSTQKLAVLLSLPPTDEESFVIQKIYWL